MGTSPSAAWEQALERWLEPFLERFSREAQRRWAQGGVDSGAKRNELSEADPDVPAKLAEQRLEWSEEGEALPRRQVMGEDDLLQLGVTERVEVEVARQVAP